MEEDGFYQKLNKLNESSGLNLLFNFRDMSMDLHQFYKIVTGNGGYHKVTKDSKWEDIASNLNQEIGITLTPTQLQKLYITILYPFEQAYHYRCPVKHTKTPKPNDIALESRDSNSFAGKRKHDNGFYAAQYHFKSKKIEHHQDSEYGHAFYEKLNKLNESCGLSILFDFRDTSIDLYKFYKFVTERGGYHQVTEHGKWEDIASDLNRENQVSSTPTQLQKLYATILYVFEQTYHCHVKHNKSPKKHDVPLESWDLNNFKGKRKHEDGFYATDYHFKSKKIERHHEKQARKEPRVPLGSRNCYQMFLKMEGERLKGAHGDMSFVQLQYMADAWKHLPSDNKRAYIEASKQDKERFIREMAAYEEHKKNQRRTTTKEAIKFSSPKLNFTTPSQEAAVGSHLISWQDDTNHEVVDRTQFDGDYHVALEPIEIASSSNDSIVHMAFCLMKNAQPNDPIFDIDWDPYGGLMATSP